MIGQGIYLSADCAGRGTCGKCKLQLLEGELEITSFDRNKLTEQELEQGYRLACKAYPKRIASSGWFRAGRRILKLSRSTGRKASVTVRRMRIMQSQLTSVPPPLPPVWLVLKVKNPVDRLCNQSAKSLWNGCCIKNKGVQ